MSADPTGSPARVSGWTVRTRLTLIAAGVVAAALAIGGPLWMRAVEYGMLEDLRERDRMRAAIEGTAFGRRFPDPMRPGAREGQRGRPRRPPFRSSELLVLEHGSEPEFIGRSEESSPELLEWLESIREDPSLESEASAAGELYSEIALIRDECRPDGFRPDRRREPPRGHPPHPPPGPEDEACRAKVEAAHQRAMERIAEIAWPQEMAASAESGRRLRTAILVRLPGEDHSLAIAIESSMASIDASLDALTRSLVFGGPLLVTLVAAVAWFLVGRSLRVVGEIDREVEQIAFGALDRKLPTPTTQDEVAGLVDTLNRMLDRLDEGARRQRAFVGDASHELRTPIATIRAQLEVALAHPDSANWVKVAGDANAEAIRMQKLVDDLLQIARLDESPEERDKRSHRVDLDDIVRTESASLRHARVGLSKVAPVRVWGVEQEIRRIVRNLLENAERYGDGRVEVRLSQTGGVARLEVEDDGPGISPRDRERVFERFTRLEESRSRSGGGAGLGLGLTRGLVNAHGGGIHIEDAEIGGARAVVTLPCERSAVSAH